MGLTDSVLFYGASDQMERMYQAMDVFLMPSNFEGLPVTGVEAQAAGLPIVFSDVITHEVAVSPNIEYVSLNKPVRLWADKVLAFKGTERRDYCDEKWEGSRPIHSKGYHCFLPHGLPARNFKGRL